MPWAMRVECELCEQPTYLKHERDRRLCPECRAFMEETTDKTRGSQRARNTEADRVDPKSAEKVIEWWGK